MNQTSPTAAVTISTTTAAAGATDRHADGRSPPRPRIALVTSSWHADIVERAAASIGAEFERRALAPSQLTRFTVPGAFEIPLFARRLATSGAYDAIIGCGFVVNGGIYRHEFVAAAVIDGLMRVQLDTDVPVLSAVLTPRDFHEHDDHRRFFAEHFVKKGEEVARACLDTLTALQTLPSMQPRVN